MKKETNAGPAGRENKPHIGIFGRCNAGKSSLLNFIVGADTAIVAPESGTTTDTVRKGYEILDFAPVVFIDTAGIDDDSDLGRRRVGRSREAMQQVDLGIIVFRDWGAPEESLTRELDQAGVPLVRVHNVWNGESPADDADALQINAAGGSDRQRDRLLDEIKRRLPENSYTSPSMFGSRVAAGDAVLLVCPIDSEAPAGRMILPQVQAIRELLDKHAVPVIVQPQEIPAALDRITPVLVVTDSQVYSQVRGAVAAQTPVTTFSILLATAKGDYGLYLQGLDAVDRLRDGDRVLIAESCSHQVSCEDIGRVKIPRWLEEHTGKKLRFTTVSGLAALPADLPSYALMVQCGACMVTRTQLLNRLRRAAAAGVPVTNYGMLIKKIRP